MHFCLWDNGEMGIARSNDLYLASSNTARPFFQSGSAILTPTSNPRESQFLHYVFWRLCFNAWSVISTFGLMANDTEHPLPLHSLSISMGMLTLGLSILYILVLSLLGCSLLDQASPASLYFLWRDSYTWTEHLQHLELSLEGCSSWTEHLLHSCTLSGWMLLLFLCQVFGWTIWRLQNIFVNCIYLLICLGGHITVCMWGVREQTTCGSSCSPFTMPSLGTRCLHLLGHPVSPGGSFDLWRFSIF